MKFVGDADDKWTAAEREIEIALRAVCPELRRVPIYVAHVGLMAQESAAPSTVRAVTYESLDIALQPYLANRWRGRGLALVYSRRTEMEPSDLFPTVIHEVSHCLRDGYLREIRAHKNAKPFSFAMRATVGMFTESSAYAAPEDPKKIAGDHDAEWCRIALILRHRLAWKFGLCLPVPDLAQYSVEDLPVPIVQLHYAMLASNEYAATGGMTMNRVMKRPFPDEYARAWIDATGFSLPCSTSTKGVAMKTQLENLKAAERERRNESEDRFQQLAMTVADGDHLDADAVLDALERLARTAADLDAAAAVIVKRRSLQGQVEAGARAADQRADAVAAFASLDQAEQKRRAEFDRRAAAHGAAIAELDQAVKQGKAARRQLEETAPQPLINERRDVLASVNMLDRQRHELRRRVSDAKTAALLNRDRGNGDGSLKLDGQQLERELAGIEAEIVELQATVAEISERMLETI